VSNDQADMHQEVIIDHGRHPHNFRKLENATRIAEGANPLCGNQLTVHLELTDGRINDIASRVLEGPSRRPALLMSTVLIGKSEEETFAPFGDVHAMLTLESDGDVDLARLGSRRTSPNVGVPHVGQVRHARRCTIGSDLDDDAPRSRE
jgi:nitrogen fixation NifU-like protein